MPDQNSPAAKPEPSAEPGEFDFAAPAAENPRLKRRSLKARPSTSLKPASGSPPAARELEREAPPLSPEAATQQARPAPIDDEDNDAVKFTEPEPAPFQPKAAPEKSSQPHYASTARPGSNSTPATSSQGNRHTMLYYSTGARKEKEEPTPMKSTPTASPASSPATQPSPARSTASSTVRPSGVVDYRANVERQAREQKSIGGMLAIIVYVLIGFFVIGASLAGYGIYAISKQLHQQSLTMGELDQRYTAENQALTAQLKSTMDTLATAQSQIGRQQELILQQQQAINKLMAANEASAAALRQERQTRADETSSLRARVRDLENESNKGTTTQRY